MKKHTNDNQFTYRTGDNTVTKGFFNIYQAKDGGIYIKMGITVTKMTESQLQDLGIDVYSLIDFDHDQYMKQYKNEAAGISLSKRK